MNDFFTWIIDYLFPGFAVLFCFVLLIFEFVLPFVYSTPSQRSPKKISNHSDNDSNNVRKSPSDLNNRPKAVDDNTIFESSTGAPNKDSDIKQPKWSNAVGIGFIVFVFICIAVIIGYAICISPKEEKPAPHTHEYINGQCSCSDIDESYCRPIYRSIVNTMTSMRNPMYDLNFIETELEKLPHDYLDVKRITQQTYVLKKQCEKIYSEVQKLEPDYQKVNEGYLKLLDYKSKSAYDNWNINRIIRTYIDLDKLNAYLSEIESETTSESINPNGNISTTVGQYIGNPTTKKYHLPSCSYLPDEENRIYLTLISAASQGYSPCKHCCP